MNTRSQTVGTAPADKLKLIGAGLLVILGIVAFYYFAEQSLIVRILAVVAGVIAAAALALTTAPGQATWNFATSARTEVRKVVWPTKRETVQATIIVVIMVIFVAILLWIIDSIAFKVIYDWILGLRR